MAKVTTNNGQTSIPADLAAPTQTPATDGTQDALARALAARQARLDKTRVSAVTKVAGSLTKATIEGATSDRAFGRHTLSALLAAQAAGIKAEMTGDADFEDEASLCFQTGEKFLQRTLASRTLSKQANVVSEAFEAAEAAKGQE